MAVGIKDVARVADVSIATVSRVLGGRNVDPTMRDRVLEAVRATDYRPNLAARRLRSQHTNTIGLIVADIRNPFFTAVSRAIENLAYARGLRVILCNTDEDSTREGMYLRLMEEERVTGVILAPTQQGLARLSQVKPAHPMILIDRAASGIPHDCVVLDNVAMATVLVEHLHARGFRRIAGLFGASSSTGEERRAGFEAASQRLGLIAEAIAVPHGDGEVARIVADLVSRPDRPEALVASNGVTLMAIVRELHRLGMSVPDGMALAGFDNEGWMDIVGGGLSVIEQPVEEIGHTAMTMLLDRLDHADAAVRKVVLAGRLIARGSSATPGDRRLPA